MRYLILIITLVISACGNNTDPWVMKPLSDFNIQQDALKNGAKVKILYFSDGPMITKSRDYYFQYVVVDRETGDTFKILCPNSMIELKDFDSEYLVYTSVNSKDTLDRYTLVGVFNENPRMNNVSDAIHIELKEYDKVASDPKFEEIENMQVPVVIGTILKTGNVSDTNFRKEIREQIGEIEDTAMKNLLDEHLK